MLKLNEVQAFMLWDTLALYSFSDNDNKTPENTLFAMNCSTLFDKVIAEHTQFTTDDIEVMHKALTLVIKNGENIQPEFFELHHMISRFKDTDDLTIEYT